MDKNDKKSKMLIGMIVAICAILLVAIIYQFVCIKRLQRKIAEYESSGTSTSIGLIVEK